MTNDKRDIKRDILKRDILGKNKRTKEHEGFGQRKRDIFVITPDTTSYRDAKAHLKMDSLKEQDISE